MRGYPSPDTNDVITITQLEMGDKVEIGQSLAKRLHEFFVPGRAIHPQRVVDVVFGN